MMSIKWSFLWKRLRSAWTIPDLRKNILFTLGLLLVFRILLLPFSSECTDT